LSSGADEKAIVDPQSDYNQALEQLSMEFQRVLKPIPPEQFSFATNILLDALSKHFLEAHTAASQQLNLPGIPAKEIRQLITPAKFKLSWATLDISGKQIETLLGIVFDKDDAPVQMKALEEFLDYFDKNYDVFIRIVHNVMVKILWSAAEEVMEERAVIPHEQAFSNMRPMSEHTEPYQRKVRKGHRKMKIRLIGKGGQKNTAPYSKKPPMKRSKSAPPAE